MDQQTEKIVQLYREGAKTKDIVARLGLNPSTIYRALRKGGITPSRRKIVDEERVQRLFASGHRPAEIAEMMGLARSTVYAVLSRQRARTRGGSG